MSDQEADVVCEDSEIKDELDDEWWLVHVKQEQDLDHAANEYNDPVQAADVSMQQTDVKTEEDDFVSDEKMVDFQLPHVEPIVVCNVLNPTRLVCIA